MTEMSELAAPRIIELTSGPDTRFTWLSDLRRHLDVLMVLARKDFQTRYKRASLGLAWAVVVPVFQGLIMAAIFSRVVKSAGGNGYADYVISGMFAFAYFSQTLGTAVTSIVDGASLSDKVWFPRILLVTVPALANLVGLAITFAFLLAALPLLGGRYSIHLLLLVPALLLLVSFTTALALVLSALHVYFRDVKFLVQAALMVWIYLTPVIYPISLVHRFAPFVIANPMTGIVALVHLATLGTSRGAVLVPLLISVGTTALLAIAGAEAQRRHDRLFVDLL
ncbi:MAG TPA: ABC transporter permease [Acidimicrobiales bacterium]